jgi:hypothetical protein
MLFAKKTSHDLVPAPLIINGDEIEYVKEWKYLGVLITSNPQFSFSIKKELRSFHCSVNSVCSALRKPNETILMKILYSNCVPILSYACEVKEFSSKEMSQCNVAVNNAIRKIFSYHRWESIRSLRESLSYSDLYTIFAQRRNKFLKRVKVHENLVLQFLHTIIPTVSPS